MLANTTATAFGGRDLGSAANDDRACGGGAVSGVVARSLLGLCVVVAVAAVGFSVHQRYTLARDLTWQCDELPVLARFTSVGGAATTEAEARNFEPSFYSLRTGAIRSLRIPRYSFSPQTTTHFWTSLTLNLFGYSTLAGRIMPLVWGFVAIAAVGWATWLCVRSIPASCIASLIVAFSPAATAYSAQARGYGEAIALLPVMLVALELWRRKSSSWIRTLFLTIVTVQLSLTVYTMWVYWVFPVLILAVVVLPRRIENAAERPAARATLVGLLVLMCIWMGIFTAERWKPLMFLASYGAHFESWGDFGSFLQLFVERLIPLPLVTIPLVVVGVCRFHRTSTSWWRLAMLAGLTLPLVFCIANGSPGHMRNLFYILGPLSIAAGVGFCTVLGVFSQRGRPVAVGALSLVVIGGLAASSSAALADRAYQFLLPDWGAVVRSIDAEPKAVGPRLLCPCAANHWQINWYRDRSDDAAIASLSLGDRIEVVIGAQLNDAGEAVIYRHNKRLDGIRAEVLPRYLARISATGVRAGVELRRWRGTKVRFADLPASDAPVLVLTRIAKTPLVTKWARFLREYGAYDAGVVPFQTRYLDGEPLHIMVVPSGFADRADRFLRVECGATDEDFSWIELSPL